MPPDRATVHRPTAMTTRQRAPASLLFALLALTLVTATGALHAQDDAEQTREKIEQLERDIARVGREIDSASAQRSKVQDALRAAERELGRVQRAISDNRRAVNEGEAKLAQLREREGQLKKAADEQQARIAAEMKTAWQMGRESQLKMLLSQEEPEKVARNMGYYRYLFEARSTLLDEYRETLSELATVATDIDRTLATLATSRQVLDTEQSRLAAAEQKQKVALADLNSSISSKSARRKKLESDRAELEKLLEAIEQAIVQLELPTNFQNFAKSKGAMPWPVEGRRSNRFGRPRNEGKMRWQGVTIPAPQGTTVRAIHHGRVVYADWFRGSGLLLIIDHGDDYMSLYAHNQSLLMDVGEWVTAGTAISTVGNSGGREQSALYFEIRYKGKPTDPARWCTGS
jgi:septal ring factor EnvC (AmiA/AmiB activator)